MEASGNAPDPGQDPVSRYRRISPAQFRDGSIPAKAARLPHDSLSHVAAGRRKVLPMGRALGPPGPPLCVEGEAAPILEGTGIHERWGRTWPAEQRWGGGT